MIDMSREEREALAEILVPACEAVGSFTLDEMKHINELADKPLLEMLPLLGADERITDQFLNGGTPLSDGVFIIGEPAIPGCEKCGYEEGKRETCDCMWEMWFKAGILFNFKMDILGVCLKAFKSKKHSKQCQLAVARQYPAFYLQVLLLLTMKPKITIRRGKIYRPAQDHAISTLREAGHTLLVGNFAKAIKENKRNKLVYMK